MKNIHEYLRLLGFSEIEATLYLILLRSGPMTVAKLAQQAHTNRTATYEYINSLMEKGTIVKLTGTSTKVAANPPETLHNLIEQKADIVKTLKHNLPVVIATLNETSAQKKQTTHSIKYYKGRNGVKAIYSEALQTKELRTYFNGTDIEKVFPENLKLFTNAFQKNPHITMFEIRENSPSAKDQLQHYQGIPRYFYKFLPNDVSLLANDILMYDDKVAIINVGDPNNVTGVILHNKEYYNNSKQLFDLLWRTLPEPSS